jgi:hypothetical protein
MTKIVMTIETPRILYTVFRISASSGAKTEMSGRPS